ncbi:hypothetical protein N7532_006162 [Penicillium argentinense]|uniref:Uncharacterized protein n=1 Tax=Penicillium argentinense TaxID=1131581 RepID=A0A9W9FFH0_9EURO|nr:uncharacterized protein N7532_006162 [Penicillium argentinense]KAJ5099161.1 hypothetical protein N7532_006162 [Penicillium argentinense]
MNPSSGRHPSQQGFSRRPAAPCPPSSNAPTGNNGLSSRPSHRLHPTNSDSGSNRNIKVSENKDIVVRDKNGAYKFDAPNLPSKPHVVDANDEEIEAELETEYNSTEPSDADRARLIHATYDSVIRHGNIQSNEEHEAGETELPEPPRLGQFPRIYADCKCEGCKQLLELLREDLRKKAASLDEDNWMFEPERDMRS